MSINEAVRELCAALAFSEYRQYSRIQLVTNRGWDQYLPKSTQAQSADPVIVAASTPVGVDTGQPEQSSPAIFFVPRNATAAPGPVPPALPTAAVGLNEAPAAQYDLMSDLLHFNMFKVFSDMLRSESLRIQQYKSAKFGYLPMMTVDTLGALNTESFCERVLSCLKLVVSDFRGDSDACHAPDESRVHGVHEGELPGHSIVGIQSS